MPLKRFASRTDLPNELQPATLGDPCETASGANAHAFNDCGEELDFLGDRQRVHM